MATGTSQTAPPRPGRSTGGRRPAARGRRTGGTEGNERLTVLTGLLLFVLFAALGVTIVAIGRLLWLHLFLGLVLLGPIALKLASTGYRFARYYTSDPAYRAKGPPAPVLRGLAPLVVFFTVAVFATGVALLVLGPSSRNPLNELHKLSFIAWIAVTALHVLGHLPETLRVLDTARDARREIVEAHGDLGPGPAIPGRAGRGAALVVALAGGLVLALVLVGQFAAWTHFVGQFAAAAH